MEEIKTVFKRCTAKDLSEVITLCNEIFKEDTKLKDAEKSFAATEKDPNQLYINGWAEGKIVAHVKLTIVPTFYKGMGTYSVVNHFCVAPKYRRHHIASQMLDEITKISRDLGCKSMKLWSLNFRTDAHSFYKHMGFEKLEAGFFEMAI